jgi:hypothetical protein
MNKLFFVAIAFTVALVGPAYAAGRFAPALSGPKVVAGQVDEFGRPVKGAGFRSMHLGEGRYEIEFDPGVLPGCAAMVVTPLKHDEPHEDLSDVVPATEQIEGCTPIFRVLLWVPGSTTRRNHGFQFVAV